MFRESCHRFGCPYWEFLIKLGLALTVACGLYPLSSTWYEEAPAKIAPGSKELAAAIELKPCQYETTLCWFSKLMNVAENASFCASLFLFTLIECAIWKLV